MSDELVTRLGRVDLFSGVSKRALRRMYDAGREVSHGSGHTVAAEGLGASAFHLILEGSAQVRVGTVNRPELGPGDYFGEISVLDGRPRSATITAGENGLKAFAIPAVGFRTALDKEPEMARTLMVNLCSRIRSIEAASAG